MATNVLLLGSSGIPGRYILASLLRSNAESATAQFNITVLKRAITPTESIQSDAYRTNFYGYDLSETSKLTAEITVLEPQIVISALNAEPSPVLDNYVVDALLEYQARKHTEGTSGPVFFINGYTLDIMHGSVDHLPPSARASLTRKRDLADRLRGAASKALLEYCTIVNAAFLDYCLVKGYSAVNFDSGVATLVDDGDKPVTGCSLEFVGDVVALVVKYCLRGSDTEKGLVRNKRLRVAETRYSGREITECVEKVTGRQFERRNEKGEDVLARGAIVRYLNWAGTGAANFEEDGLQFGKEILKRRTLEEICKRAIEDGVGAFEGVGR